MNRKFLISFITSFLFIALASSSVFAAPDVVIEESLLSPDPFSSNRDGAKEIIVANLSHVSTLVRIGEFTLFGPKDFMRGEGYPITVTDNFSVLNPNTGFLLRVYNGGLKSPNKELFSSAVISINGKKVLGPKKFNETIKFVEIPISLRFDNVIKVKVIEEADDLEDEEDEEEDDDNDDDDDDEKDDDDDDEKELEGLITVHIVGIDNGAPAIKVIEPGDGSFININHYDIKLSFSDGVSGIDPTSFTISINDIDETSLFNITMNGLAGKAEGTVLLPSEGTYTIKTSISDIAGNNSSITTSFIVDTIPPQVAIDAVNSPTNQSKQVITGSYVEEHIDTIMVDNTPATIDHTANTYSAEITLGEGKNWVTVRATDLAGNSATATTAIVLDTVAPQITIDPVNSPTNDSLQAITGSYVEEHIDTIVVNGIDAILDTKTSTYSAEITLIEGENIITVVATDLAGNTSTATTIVVYDPNSSGEIISSEGGKVVSSNGKVSLDLPQGALVDPTWIWMSLVDKNSLKDATPSERVVLTAIKCGPDGTVFNKSVKITYTLDEAEVPGTSLELGIYDASQNKITLTGQTSVVSADSYTVNFSLNHFSVYAVLKSLVSFGAPIGPGVKMPLPDMLTGAFSHSIPIAIPPGRKGMQPSLKLVYRSSNSNSWTGVGFGLNPGYIIRSTRLGPPTYVDTQDTFYFVTDAGTTELVHLVDNLYQAKVESSFTKFFKQLDGSWKVVSKDGSVLWFGQAAESKEASPQGTYSWYITKAVDTNGNYIQYSYIKDQSKSYLRHIDYTGNENGTLPTNSVEFFLEPRDDVASSYMSGARIATTKRLKEIQVKVNAELVWRYVLEYIQSLDTNRSLLKSITQYAADGKHFPTQTFEYQEAE